MNIQKIKDKLRESLNPANYYGDVVAILNNGHSIVVRDDSCYVLYNWNGMCWVNSAWIFEDVMKLLKTLPTDPSKATLYPYKELVRKSKIKKL